MIGPDMVHDLIQRAAAVARRVLDLRANFPERLALPTHFNRREMPDLVSMHATGFEIRRLMTNRTAHGRQAKAVISTGDRWLMQTPPRRHYVGGRQRDDS